jgi:uncharacterized protein
MTALTCHMAYGMYSTDVRGRGNLESLRNYRNLVAKVDEKCRRIVSAFPGEIACREGCADCCRHISVFPVEGVALAVAGRENAAFLRERTRAATPGGLCPLLENERCLLYAARPLICRTHGLPIHAIREGRGIVDFCSRNFRRVSSLPGEAVISVDHLNAALSTINRLFVAEYYGGSSAPGRITVAEALLLEIR